MEEVQVQLKPFKELLDSNTKLTESISRRLYQLWSNGSGGPPGYLERAREEDKRRNDQVDQQHAMLTRQMNDLKEQIVQEGGVQKGIDKADKRHSQSVGMWVTVIGL